MAFTLTLGSSAFTAMFRSGGDFRTGSVRQPVPARSCHSHAGDSHGRLGARNNLPHSGDFTPRSQNGEIFGTDGADAIWGPSQDLRSFSGFLRVENPQGYGSRFSAPVRLHPCRWGGIEAAGRTVRSSREKHFISTPRRHSASSIRHNIPRLSLLMRGAGLPSLRCAIKRKDSRLGHPRIGRLRYPNCQQRQDTTFSKRLGFLYWSMRTISRIGGLRVVIYPNDHRPAHLHLIGDGEVMVMLNCPDGPSELRASDGFSRSHVARIGTSQAGHLATLCAEWRDIHDRC